MNEMMYTPGAKLAERNSSQWTRRVGNTLASIAAVSSVVGLSSIDSAPAEAEVRPVIGSGSLLINVTGIGGCNVAAVDEDENVAITAGHCGEEGHEFFDPITKQRVGVMRDHESIFSNNNAVRLDYGILKLDKKVRLRNIVRLAGVEQPRRGMKVFKFGAGIGNAGKRAGEITSVLGTSFASTVYTFAIDSGAPVYSEDNGERKLVGIVSGEAKGKTVSTNINEVLERTGIEPMLG